MTDFEATGIPRTQNQHTLEQFRRLFLESAVHGRALLDYLGRSEVHVWRFERDNRSPGRWWLNITLPRHVADMFELHREIQVMYTEYERLEPRGLGVLQARVRKDLRVEPGFAVVVSRDPNVKQLANRQRGELAVVDINLDEVGPDNPDLRARIADVVSTVDHYDVTNPVRDPAGFFGRSSEIDQISRALDHGQSVGVFGLRKAGKTSLMNSISALRKEAGHAVVQLDISEVTTADEFRLRLLERIWHLLDERDNVDPRGVRLRLLSKQGELRTDAPTIALHWTSDLRKLLDASDVRVELFIDEIDQAFPGRSTLHDDEASRLFQTLTQLRGFIQEGRQLVLLGAGVDPGLFESPLVVDRDNLLYKLVRLIWLSPLSRDETAEMVRSLGRRMGVRVRGHESLDALYREYGGHPLLTRKACSVASKGRVPSELPFHLSIDQVENAIRLRGPGTPQAQAIDVLKSFSTWFPAEAELLELMYSSDAELREFADGEILKNPDALTHAVAYGMCFADKSPRILAAVRELGV